MFLAATIIALLSQLVLASFVLAKNSRRLRNRSFGLLAVALLFWALLNFLSVTVSSWDNSLWLMRMIMLLVVAQNSFFVLFTYSQLHEKLVLSRKAKAYIVLSSLAAILTLSPILFMSVAYGKYGPYPVAGPGMLVFIIQAFTSVFLGFRNLVRAIHHARGLQRRQILYIFVGSAVLWGIVPITNFLLALTLQTSFFVQFSPIYGFVFSAVIGLAIVRYRLFDLRMIIARSLAYILAVGAFIGLYMMAISALAYTILPSSNISTAHQFIYISLALVFAPSLFYIRRFFDRVTNRFFYHDSYDSQEFLDELNTLLTGTLELETILRQSSAIINSTFKPSFVRFLIITDAESKSYMVVTNEKKQPDRDKQNEVATHLNDIDRDVILTDETTHGLYTVLDKENIALAIRLTSSKQHIGYLLLGIRLGGTPYSRSDVSILEIVGNELAISIQNASRFDQIQHFNETLQEEVDDATRRLRYTNSKLKALDETKDEFISMASHQLRTPLTSVKGYLSMVLDGDMGELNEQQRKMLAQAFTSSQRMNYLISDLLNVSRLRTGKFVIEPSDVYLPDVIEGEIDQLQETAHSKNQTLTFDKPTEFPILSLDETKIRQVIMNFMDNALHYTPEGGKIRVELEARPKAIEFRVIDNGLGVPKAEQHKLFGKFFRAGNARHVRPDGTGLGLFMAKKVVIAQGGSIVFKSQEGKGSTFGFIFPLKHERH